jgi:Transglutaminase-like superfamily
LPSSALSIDAIVRQATDGSTSDLQIAIKLHDFVRDNIAFGFTPYFDAALPETTLRLGVGHCNPQARLMVELFRRGGLEARYQPVTITDAILRGALPAIPLLSHIFTEVRLGGKWLRLDSYIADPALRTAAVAKLRSQSRELGYGCHVTATGDWDGKRDCFSQVATQDMILELHEPVMEVEEFYQSDKLSVVRTFGTDGCVN